MIWSRHFEGYRIVPQPWLRHFVFFETNMLYCRKFHAAKMSSDTWNEDVTIDSVSNSGFTVR